MHLPESFLSFDSLMFLLNSHPPLQGDKISDEHKLGWKVLGKIHAVSPGRLSVSLPRSQTRGYFFGENHNVFVVDAMALFEC